MTIESMQEVTEIRNDLRVSETFLEASSLFIMLHKFCIFLFKQRLRQGVLWRASEAVHTHTLTRTPEVSRVGSIMQSIVVRKQILGRG